MGTNYYLKTDHCDSCDRYETRHIGKASFGWPFMFHGYRNEEEKPTIISFHEWQIAFKDGLIENEYGEPITVDKFKEVIESRRQETADHGSYDWRDREGNYFCEADFT